MTDHDSNNESQDATLDKLPVGSALVVRANPAAAGSKSLAIDFDSALQSLLRQDGRRETRWDQGAS